MKGIWDRSFKTIIVWSALCLGACVPSAPPAQPHQTQPPAPIVINDPTFPQQCADIWQQELGRPIDPAGLDGCLVQFRRGDSGGQVRAVVQASDEYAQRQAAMKAAADLNGGERGRIHVEGVTFKHDDGSIYPWRGTDGFLDLGLQRLGLDLQPLFVDRLVDARTKQRRPVNLVRVFASLDWRNQHDDVKFAAFGGNGPLIAPDATYYDDIVRLVDWYWARGVRVELSFGDLVKIFPNHADRVAFANAIGAALRDRTASIFGEVNEPGHGDQVDAAEAQEFTQILHGYGWLVANGVYDWPTGTAGAVPHGDYGTRHGSRSDQWPRDSRGAAEIRDGFDWNDAAGNHFDGLHIPIVEDEQMGAAEQSIDGKRSANCDDHAQSAAAAVLFVGNYTFHSDNGTYSQLFEPVQGACATAALTAAAFIDPGAQLAAYQRGGEGGGAGINNMPIEHHDLEESAEPRALRSFCKDVSGIEYCVAIRPTQDHVTPRDGWSIDTELRKGIVTLKRALATFFSFVPALSLR